jgi:hypothetical protein
MKKLLLLSGLLFFFTGLFAQQHLTLSVSANTIEVYKAGVSQWKATNVNYVGRVNGTSYAILAGSYSYTLPYSNIDSVSISGAAKVVPVSYDSVYSIMKGLTTAITSGGGGGGGGDASAANQVIGNNYLAAIDAGIPASLGQKIMSASMPVVIASDQGALAISAASLPLPTGAATAAGISQLHADLIAALPAGSNVIGSIANTGFAVTNSPTIANTGFAVTNTPTVNVNGTVPVSGTFWQATQPISAASAIPVSQTGNFTVIQPTAANLNVTAAIAAAQTLATVTTVGTLTTLANGQTAHSSAATGSPVRAGMITVPTTAATVDATLVAGDAANLPGTTGYQLITKQWGTAELDYAFNGTIPNTTAIPFKNASGTANVRNYCTEITLSGTTNAVSGTVYIEDALLTAASQTIASNTLTTSTNHDLKIGDLVTIATSTVTGLTATANVYVLTVPSATTVTFSNTPNGSTLAISGTSVTATLYRVLWQGYVNTASTPLVHLQFSTPLRGAPNSVMNIQTPTAATGTIIYNVHGYVGF